jgi:phage shock protein E
MGFFSRLFGSSPSVDLQELINKGAFLVDVRTPGEFEGGHVPNSTNIPVDEIQTSIKKFENKENIIVFCRSGNRSSIAKKILIQHGITNVVNGGTWKNVLRYSSR